MADNQDTSNQAKRTVMPARKMQARKMPTPLSTIRVTDQGLDEFLADHQTHFPPGPDTFEFIQHGTHAPFGNNEEEEMDFETGFSSGGHHVGRDLEGKEAPQRPLDSMGPNPHGDRKFYADEFQGMLTFDRAGKPTFHSRFPEAKSAKDIKELRINIATKLPAYMTGDTPQAEELEAMEEDAFDGHALDEVFSRVDDKMVAQVEQYAKEFEQAYGIKMTVGFDIEDAHLSLMGYTKGDPNLLGFASFPPGINDWAELEGLGAHPGYMVMNNQYTETATEKEVYDLFVHEFGHTMGLAHPHDLAMLNMSKREALTATKMAYTDLKLRAFRHVVTDAEGEPVLDKEGNKQYYHAGPDEGVLDFGFRKWTADAPNLGHVENPDPKDPKNDLYKGVYDLAAHTEFAKAENGKSIVFQRERLLPMVPMINDGKNTVLKGTPGDDYLDTNPGYASTVKAEGSRATQKFILVEGHMEKVMGISGNNIIVAAEKGAQEIHPGTGENELRFVYPDMKGEKTIISEGKDTLVLTEDVLAALKFKASKGKNGVTLDAGDAKITLGGNGLQKISIVNDLGKAVAEIDVQGMGAEELNSKVFEGNAWKQEAAKQAKPKKAKAEEPEAPKVRENEPPESVTKDDKSKDKDKGKGQRPWLERVTEERAVNASRQNGRG